MLKVETNQFRLQYITHCNERFSYIEGAEMALEGGCRWIQLRMKKSSRDEILSVARHLKQKCKEKNAIFLIDDHVDICSRVKADGVHLGKNDMSIYDARSFLGEGFIIGATCHDVDEIEDAYCDGADYAGVGPFRFTTTKENLNTVLGIEGYQRIVKECWQRGLSLPLTAIGGIETNHIAEILKTGMDSIAISGTILNAENPIEQTKKIISQWKI